MRLLDYIKPLTSDSFDWIASLTLTGITCLRTDLVHISHLTNIGALTVGPNVQAPEIGLDDSIIRTWARMAGTSNGFNMLRVIICRSQKDLSSRVFAHLSHFPALAVFNVEDCNIGSHEKPTALGYGWRYKLGKDPGDRSGTRATKGAGWDSFVKAAFALGGQFSDERLTTEDITVIDALPFLHLSLGGFPANAAVDRAGNHHMRYFYRLSSVEVQECDFDRSSQKRPLVNFTSSTSASGRKRPRVRDSKQQSIADLSAYFAG